MIDYDPKRWLRIVLTLRGSVAPRLVGRVGLAVALSTVAVWAHGHSDVAIPPLAHSLIGVALGLLLVFRTNASYGRYVEARELLGRVNNTSRDLARQVATYVEPHAERAVLYRDVHRYLVAFFQLLVQSLRDEDQLDALADQLEPHEREALRPIRARGVVLARWLGSRIHAVHRQGKLRTSPLRAMDGNLGILVAALGGCERIRRTPVPFAYAQHIKVFLVLFCYTVPFAMVETLEGYTPLAAAILAFALFGIDEIGVEIENPFGTDPNDLPLERIGQMIDHSVGEVLTDAAGALAPK
jgi:ion channel-forming bestrophin family protein